MEHPRFFGFGSLVNTATHVYPVVQTATAIGWERVWVQSVDHPHTFLSARPCEGVSIDGLVCTVPGGDWTALDARESGYVRTEVSDAVSLPAPVALYATPHLQAASDPAKMVLLSYVDVVVQGFLERFGEDGVARFFATTTGWNVPVLADRSAPRYPRHQVLTDSERALVDHHLSEKGVQLIPV